MSHALSMAKKPTYKQLRQRLQWQVSALLSLDPARIAKHFDISESQVTNWKNNYFRPDCEYTIEQSTGAFQAQIWGAPHPFTLFNYLNYASDRASRAYGMNCPTQAYDRLQLDRLDAEQDFLGIHNNPLLEGWPSVDHVLTREHLEEFARVQLEAHFPEGPSE